MSSDPIIAATSASMRPRLKKSIACRCAKHIEGDGPTIFAHACEMGLEGIVSKRKDSLYHSGRSRDWLTLPTVSR